MSFDHLVLVVVDLASATREFTALGFTVIPGGTHAGGLTHNALIALADGSYLELLAPVRPARMRFFQRMRRLGALGVVTAGRHPFQQRFIRHLAAGEGLADFALLSPDLQADVDAARRRGLKLAGPFSGGRQRPDGERIAWRFAFPADESLPFLIEDLTPRELRVPGESERTHANGVSGAAALLVAAQDLEESLERYRSLLGVEPQAGAGFPLPGALSASSSSSFTLGGLTLILFEQDQVTAMRQSLARRPASPHTLWLRTTTSAASLALSYSSETGYTLLPG